MNTLATVYTTTLPASSTDALGIIATIGLGTIVICLVVGLLINLALTWGVYKKGGYKGWEGIVPIYNTYCIYKMANVSMALFVVSLFFPVVNVYAYIKLAENFGKDALYGIGLFLLGFIFFPILGYGDAVYQGKKPATAPMEPITPATPTPEATDSEPAAETTVEETPKAEEAKTEPATPAESTETTDSAEANEPVETPAETESKAEGADTPSEDNNSENE